MTGQPKKKTILVVDDDYLTLSLVASLLKAQNYEVETAQSGSVALELVERKPVDLIVLDIALPHADGYAVAEKLREKLGKPLPILALTGRPGRDSEREKMAGFTGWLEKPFDVSDLVDAVKRQLRAR